MLLNYLIYETGVVLSYAGCGLLLMVIGYFVVDLLTPGKLHVILWEQKSRNAAVLVASDLAGVAIIVIAAIRASSDDLAAGILSTLVFGLLGIMEGVVGSLAATGLLGLAKVMSAIRDKPSE